MNVTFRNWGAHLASSRYRALIPAAELEKLGVGVGRDWLIIGKHGWNWGKQTEGFERVCFDICDDHFDKEHGPHYLACAERADLITCNSTEMARIIMNRTARRAVVIPDPYEQPEGKPRINDNLLWFGHQTNFPDLLPWLGTLKHLEVVTNGIQGATEWTPEAMDQAFERAGLVVIPTGKSMAKSANRAIESLRRGLFVVSGYLPAYADLGVYMGHIGDGIDWALSHQSVVLDRIEAAQRYIRTEYSPKRIAELWKQALS